MTPTDPRCENCDRLTTQDSRTTSAALPAWARGVYCPDCVRLADRLVAENPDGPERFTPPS